MRTCAAAWAEMNPTPLPFPPIPPQKDHIDSTLSRCAFFVGGMKDIRYLSGHWRTGGALIRVAPFGQTLNRDAQRR